MEKQCLFKAVLLFLGILASILACMALTLLVYLLVILLSRMSSNASENESFGICGFVPFQGLNPWMVQVLTQKGSSRSLRSCGGSFISSTRIITAAHCIDTNMSRDSRYNVYFNGRSYEASLVGFEPSYANYDQKMWLDKMDFAILKTDLAILKVNAKPDLVVPLCLPPKNYFVENTDLILTSPRGGKCFFSQSRFQSEICFPLRENVFPCMIHLLHV